MKSMKKAVEAAAQGAEENAKASDAPATKEEERPVGPGFHPPVPLKESDIRAYGRTRPPAAQHATAKAEGPKASQADGPGTRAGTVRRRTSAGTHPRRYERPRHRAADRRTAFEVRDGSLRRAAAQTRPHAIPGSGEGRAQQATSGGHAKGRVKGRERVIEKAHKVLALAKPWARRRRSKMKRSCCSKRYQCREVSNPWRRRRATCSFQG
jgi:hypothetical protein